MPDWPLDLDLEYMKVVCAPYGGPIAATRDPNQIVPIKGTSKPVIRIFDTVGQELGKIWVRGDPSLFIYLFHISKGVILYTSSRLYIKTEQVL